MAYYNPYEVSNQENLAPLSGAASGAAAGNSVLPGIGTAIGAVVGAAGGFFKRDAAYKEAIDTLRGTHTPTIVDNDPFGRPTFNSDAAAATDTYVNQLRKDSKKNRRKSRITMGFAGRRKLSVEQNSTANRLSNELQTARDTYNNEMLNYNNMQTAWTQYNQMINNQNRLNTLYNIGTSLY